MREARQVKPPLQLQVAHPPEWLPEAHATADLGRFGYHFPHPRQEEDILTEANVQDGLHLPTPVAAETWGALETFRRRSKESDTVAELEDLMNQIFARRSDAVVIQQSTFRMPQRVTPNDAKRQAWFADLANPSVPLHKLGKSVPHGAKGQDLLDLLHANDVAIPRAVWFLRVFGANEVAGLRHKPAYDPTQYSVEWANVVTSHLKKQLGDIILPSAPRPTLNIKSMFRSVLADSENRARWISRFTYSLDLLGSFYSEGLVDNRTFLTWLVLQMCTCNLAQAGFVARLADEYLDGILACRALARPFVDACISKISEIRSSSAREYLLSVESSLKVFLQRACLVIPDAFISPRMWITHAILLQEILNGKSGHDISTRPTETVYTVLGDNFSDIQKRNDAMWFRNLPPRVLARLTEAVSDVTKLNSIGPATELETFNFFDAGIESEQLFAAKLDRLLTWSVTSLQFGDHRPYVAATILRRARAQWGARAARRNSAAPDGKLQDLLFEWLDKEDTCNEVASVALLFGELVRSELFSYASYVQRLIARCEPGLLYSEKNGSRHREFLRWIPLHNSTPAIVNQRRVTLYGVRARDTPEESNEREMRREVRLMFPEIFNPGLENGPPPLPSTCTTLLGAPRYQQVRTIRQWYLPLLLKQLPNFLDNPLTHVFVRLYCVAIDLMAQVKCYRAVLELSLGVLERPCRSECLTIVVEMLRRYSPIWAGMGALREVTLALYAANQLCKARGIHCRALLEPLLEMDAGRYLDASARKNVEMEITSYAQALRPSGGETEQCPKKLPEILMLSNDPRPDAAYILANSLWFHYHKSSDWGWCIWDNTFAALRVQVNAEAPRDARYATFLLHVDQHLPGGLDGHVSRWFEETGKAELISIDGVAWTSLTHTLLRLVVQGVLATTTILKGLVYPLWSHALVSGAGECEVYLQAAHDIFARLVLSGEEDWGSDMVELQRVRVRRQDVFCAPHLLLLVGAIPTLVFLEHASHVPAELRPRAAALRDAVCGSVEFRQGIYRDLNAVRDAFDKSLQYDALDESLVEPLMDALRLILNVTRTDTATIGSSEWLDTSALLSPWKLAATTIEVQFSLKQMGERLALGTPNRNTKVDRLIAKFMHHHMSTEEADFVAEMARGVGPTIACKFVNTGFTCIANILKGVQTPLTSQGVQEILDVASEQLRLLAHVVELARDDQTALPVVDPVAQDSFIEALASKIQAFEILLTQPTPKSDVPPDQATQGAVLMARLLQFNMAFRGVWTPKARSLSENLCKSTFNLALAHSAGDHLNPATFPLFLDTFMYLVDELATDTKANSTDIFRNYPQIHLAELPADMPAEYRQQLRCLLPYPPPHEAVADLVYASPEPLGQTLPGPPVMNRPWDWLFAARATGDSVRSEKNPRGFHDALWGESVFARDWAETRIPLADENSVRREDQDIAGALPTFAAARRGMSPASPAWSRQSAGSSRLQSPTQQSFTRASASRSDEPLDTERSSAGSRQLGKRKGSTVSVDSEIEIIESPPALKKVKAKAKAAPIKPRTKKK
ncbi:hypothetical protein B0F90DRAFT_1763644 [Multifurca ochricompacta]|uniref:Mediator of RNA polymerase II transcription subunit 12 n=1 Tax=Multifurca ochricompacta TaxID=376703 RepID=A0AAD4LXA9_9AGAM|nr:hypothetical protein B0F90DRAFT_1763644 [Multifurca ochricompacta]